MENEFYTKIGRYRVAEIKYYHDNKVITENFGYSSVEEFLKTLHKYYQKLIEVPDFLWAEISFSNIRGHRKIYQFQSVFEFYSFYTGILIAGELVL